MGLSANSPTALLPELLGVEMARTDGDDIFDAEGNAMHMVHGDVDYGADFTVRAPANAMLKFGDWKQIVGEDDPQASAQATVVVHSVGEDSDLTFTAIAYGPLSNGMEVQVVQGSGHNVALGVEVVGSVDDGDWLATIILPTGSLGEDLPATASEVVTAWEASDANTDATIVAEGGGTGAVDAQGPGDFAGGTGTGVGWAGPGSVYNATGSATVFVNRGTKAQPDWGALAYA